MATVSRDNLNYVNRVIHAEIRSFKPSVCEAPQNKPANLAIEKITDDLMPMLQSTRCCVSLSLEFSGGLRLGNQVKTACVAVHLVALDIVIALSVYLQLH